ncbi:MAG: hypothetical protein GY754_20450 [bacterium]|nr:hypothetical protein [bacterium]
MFSKKLFYGAGYTAIVLIVSMTACGKGMDILFDPVAPVAPVEPVAEFPELLAHWKLDTDLTDSAGSNHGAASGEFSYGPGVEGKTAAFDWTNAASVSHPSGFDKEVYTVSAWVRRFKHNTSPYIRFVNNFSLQTNSSGTWEATFEKNGRVFESGFNLPLTEWHHFTVVADNTRGNVVFYLDGKQCGDVHTIAEGEILWDKTPLYVYIGQAWEEARWNGNIDDMRVYNGRLDGPQVQYLYDSFPDPESSLPAMPGTEYRYRVIAYNSAGDSPFSEVTATTASPGTLPQLLAHWKLDNNFTDETGNNTAAIQGQFRYEKGADGNCATFDRSNYARVEAPVFVKN